MTVHLRIDDTKVTSITGFYSEITRVFMAGESWQLGESLDALNDLLHGGFGAVPHDEDAQITWTEHHVAKSGLGVEATRSYYLDKLARPETFNTKWVRSRLADLDGGVGPTYFDMILEVFADHPQFIIKWE